MNNNMLEHHYVFFHDILPNFNPDPCTHYEDIIKRLSLTCKLLNGIYGKKKECNTFTFILCDICEYRQISCEECIKTGTTICDECRCGKCGLSTNIMGNKWLIGGNCKKCSGFNWSGYAGRNLIQSVTFTYGNDENSKEVYNAEHFELMDRIKFG